VIEKLQLDRALKGINSRNPFSTLTEEGNSPNEIKKSIRAALDPHFQNKEVIDEQFYILIPEVVNLALVESDPTIYSIYHGVQIIYRRALIVDPISCFGACAAFERDIMSGLSQVWSQMYLEHDKAELPLDEFRQEAFKNIGDIIEGSLKPFLKELVLQNRLSRGKKANYDNVADLTLGTVVHELIETVDISDAFVPPPWELRLNDWRNIAQHHTSEVIGNEIVATYYIGAGKRQIRLNRDELLQVLRQIALIFRAVRTARVIFVLDNINNIGPLIDLSIPLRMDMSVISFASAIGVEGFELVDLDVSEESVEAKIRDLTDQLPQERMIHASQFVYPLWWYFKKTRLCIHFHDRSGKLMLTAETNASACQAIADEHMPFSELANHVQFKVDPL
jgi:hypothetical protein